MAATIAQKGAHHEVWQELVAADFDGGDTIVITTGIRANAASLNNTKVTLMLNSLVGTPIVPNPVVAISSRGTIGVTFQNTAAAGNQAAWVLEIDLLWSAIR